MPKSIIAIDIDDVLSASAQGFTDFSNERWGNTHRVEDYTEAWAEFWKVPLEEALKRSDEYHESGIVSEFAHFSEAVPVLGRLANKYTLVVVTSRQRELESLTNTWIEKHFPGIFESIHYAGIGDNKDHSIEERLRHTKAAVCKKLGAHYLIDDQLKHCIGVLEEGIIPLLFGSSLPDASQPIPAGIVRVQDWQAVEEYFNAQG